MVSSISTLGGVNPNRARSQRANTASLHHALPPNNPRRARRTRRTSYHHSRATLNVSSLSFKLLLVLMVGSHHIFILAVAAAAHSGLSSRRLRRSANQQSAALVTNHKHQCQHFPNAPRQHAGSNWLSRIIQSRQLPNHFFGLNQSSSILPRLELIQFGNHYFDPPAQAAVGSILKIRGGASSSKPSYDDFTDDGMPDMDFEEIDDDVSAEDLLDSIFDSNDLMTPQKVAAKTSSSVRGTPTIPKNANRRNNPKQNEPSKMEGDQLEKSVKEKADVSLGSIESDDEGIIDLDELDVVPGRDQQEIAVKASRILSKNSNVVADLQKTPRPIRRRAATTKPKVRTATQQFGNGRAPSGGENLGGSRREGGERDRPQQRQWSSSRDDILPRTSKRWTLDDDDDDENEEVDIERQKPLARVKRSYAARESTTQSVRTAPTASMSASPSNPSNIPRDSAFVRRAPSAFSNLHSPSSSTKAHAVWGPQAQHRKPKPVGPSPAKATEDERRVHESQSRVLGERKRLLANLAINLHDSHTSAVNALIRGSAAHIPPELFGQSIMQEKSACNEKFYGSVTEVASTSAKAKIEVDSTVLGEEIDSPTPTFRHIEDTTLLSYWGLTPNAKLYGGAQYHRVLRYYHHMFLTVPLPPITDNEVALLTNGITEVHDASDLMRAVALLVRHKMEMVMEDVLDDMTRRLLYVLDRQWEMVEYSMQLHRPMGGANGLGKSGDKALSEADFYRQYGSEYSVAEADLKQVLASAFHKFAEEKAAYAHGRSLEDIRSLLRYVTWDMGRARKRVTKPGQSSNQGFISQIEIVGRESSNDGSDTQKDQEPEEKQGRKSKNINKKKKTKEQSMSGSSDRIMARGGAAIGSGRRRSKKRDAVDDRKRRGGDSSFSYDENEQHEDMGDLIGGVMDRGKPDSDDDVREDSNSKGNVTANQSSLVVSSQTSPLFSGDDEVLNVLLDTVSSTMIPKSDVQANHTQAALESLVSYVTDRMRMDMSRMIRSKFNTFFLLAFYEDLGPYLRRELDTYLSTLE